MINFLRLNAVMERTGLSRSMIYELLGRNAFPRPVKLTGARINAWPDSEIDAWIESRISRRDARESA